MIDIRSTSENTHASCARIPIALLAVLGFVVWDSGYIEKWIPSQDRERANVTAAKALLIKSSSMTSGQQYTASSPVLDEVADQRGIGFRVISDSPGTLKDAPEWVQSLFLASVGSAPCLAVLDEGGNPHIFAAPASISEFRKRIGAK